VRRLHCLPQASPKKKRARREKQIDAPGLLLFAVPKLSEELFPKGTDDNQGAETDQKQASRARLGSGNGRSGNGYAQVIEKNATALRNYGNKGEIPKVEHPGRGKCL
jgi:hypothetical protein